MSKYHIELTDEERALVDLINFAPWRLGVDETRKAYFESDQHILSILKSLHDRKAIPKERLNYWNNPDYNTGRGKTSNKGEFERNGCKGKDIYMHPHFLPYLRYFLFGANLPDAVVAKFEEKVGNPDWITSSDIVPITKTARDLARQYRLSKWDAAEEFFKLSLDMGLGLSAARMVRNSVMRM